MVMTEGHGISLLSFFWRLYLDALTAGSAPTKEESKVTARLSCHLVRDSWISFTPASLSSKCPLLFFFLSCTPGRFTPGTRFIRAVPMQGTDSFLGKPANLGSWNSCWSILSGVRLSQSLYSSKQPHFHLLHSLALLKVFAPSSPVRCRPSTCRRSRLHRRARKLCNPICLAADLAGCRWGWGWQQTPTHKTKHGVLS